MFVRTAGTAADGVGGGGGGGGDVGAKGDEVNSDEGNGKSL
jgi:hypothetical protein